MQTGDCAGFGEQPSATARRLPSRINLVRALWVGGLAVAGSVFGAATANAADAGEAEEPSDGLLGSLTSTVEPVTDLSGSLVSETDKLLTDDPELSEGLLSDGSVAEEVDLSELVDKPIDEPAGTEQPGEEAERESQARERDATRRDVATDAPSERGTQPAPVDELTGGEADAAEPTDVERREPGLASVLGAVDRLTGLDVASDVGAVADELASDAAADVLGTAVPAGVSSQLPVPSAHTTAEPQEATDPLAAATGLVDVLDLPLVDDAPALESLIAPLGDLVGSAAPLHEVVHSAAPVVGNAGALTGSAGSAAGQQRQDAVRLPAQTTATTSHTPNTTADTASRSTHDATGAARSTGQDGESAVLHSSPEAGTDGLDPFGGTRGGLRPSLQVSPVAGLTVLHVGAPGAASSADQAGPSSHALLPEEAVLRARLFSAAAHTRNVEAKPIREANDPPVSPD